MSKEPVTRTFCDERVARVEQAIDTARAEIILEVREAVKAEVADALKKNNKMSWKAKATILAAVIMAASSIFAALIQLL